MESMLKKLKLKQKIRSGSSKKTNEEEWFLKNGSIFFQKLISDCNGKSIPIRNFSSSQILKATNNFDYSCLVKTSWGWDQQWYKGNIEDKPYLIKKLLKNSDGCAFNDIVLSARMSNHNNFLKLLGCCYEFSFMVAVFEYEELVALTEEGRIIVNGEESILPWSVRLRIAKEVAVAVTYLHTAFPRIIIHKDIEPSNILLDKNKNWKVKLIDFRFSVSLPEGKSRIEDERVSGKFGYMDPLYLYTSSLSEYTDVYSFGIFLLVFFTVRPASSLCKEYDSDVDVGGIIRYVKGLYENGKVDEVIDPMMKKDITSNQRPQVEAFLMLALRCCKKREEDRPKMIQVAKELKRIQTAFYRSSVLLGSDTESLK